MITQTDIVSVLQNLGTSRPAFFSEADFQLAFAWKLKEHLASNRCTSYEIFLERRFEVNNKEYYVDICIESKEELYLIELKYKTIADTVRISNRLNGVHPLKNQAANDLGRYGYLKDIYRIEKILKENSVKSIKKGYAIILTNDGKYYKEPKASLKTIDRTFRIHERTSSLNSFINPINWTFLGRSPKWADDYPSFEIQHVPLFNWHTYSTQSNSIFKYLFTEI